LNSASFQNACPIYGVPAKILQLVADGELDPGDIEDFKELDSEIQELVVNGDLDMDDAKDLT
ncbi:MAG: hypothetical protein AAB558_03240, partial [Patescibacteria group bacterium]